MHMNVGTYIHAKLFNSTTAAAELAIQNPKKYSEFASKLISAKNTSNQKALLETRDAFKRIKLGDTDLSEVDSIRRGSFGSSRGADRGAASLLERYMNHVSLGSEVDRLQHKHERYDVLAKQVLQATELDLIARRSEVGA